MAIGVALFGTECRANFEHTLQASAHAELLEQLWRLVQERRAVIELHGEEVSASFSRGCDNFWRVGFKESFRNQVFSAELENLASETKHGVDV